MKDKIKRDLINKYQNKENELINEITLAKKSLMEQKEKEKKRIEQLNKIQKEYMIEENYHKEREKNLE
jgi:hypothetical protein